MKLLASPAAVTLEVECIAIAVEKSLAAACCHAATSMVLAAQLAIRALKAVGNELSAEVWKQSTDLIQILFFYA